jgi:hypothetical protein
MIIPLYTYQGQTLTLWLPRNCHFTLSPALAYYRDDPQAQSFRGARYIIENAPAIMELQILDQCYRLSNGS